jgi:hypothetical protein
MPNLLNYGTILGFLILSFGLIFQIKKTLKHKSVEDIERKDVIARLIASLLIFVKMWQINDVYLIIGQSILMINLVTYFSLTIIFSKRRNNS